MARSRLLILAPALVFGLAGCSSDAFSVFSGQGSSDSDASVLFLAASGGLGGGSGGGSDEVILGDPAGAMFEAIELSGTVGEEAKVSVNGVRDQFPELATYWEVDLVFGENGLPPDPGYYTKESLVDPSVAAYMYVSAQDAAYNFGYNTIDFTFDPIGITGTGAALR